MPRNTVVEVVDKPAPGFRPGHERFGGRKKRTAQAARDLAASLGCDPLEFMMKIINSDTFMQTVIDADGKKKRVEIAISLDTRLDAAKTVANYLYPRLNAQTITGANDGPVQTVHFDMAEILKDPANIAAAQTLALAMAAAPVPDTPKAITAPDGEGQKPLPPRDWKEDLAVDSKGHWVYR